MNTAHRFAMACLLVLGAAARPAITAAAPSEPVLASPPLRLPVPATRTLANGLRVEVFVTRRLPLVQAQLLAPAGSAQEPDHLPGLAALTAELLRRGTTSRSAEEFGFELGNAGANLTTWAGRDFALVAATCPRQSTERLLELMSDAVRNPLLAGEQFQAELDAWIRRLAVQRQNPAELADQRVAEAAFAPHPYAHGAGSHITALAEARSSDVLAFHGKYWRPDRAVLSIAGDVSPEEAFTLAEDWFADWQGKTSPDRPRPAPQPHAGVLVVEAERLPRAEIRVAVLGPGISQPGYASWALTEAALEAAGLPSGVRASLVSARDAGLLVLSSSVSPDQAAAQAARMTGALRTFAASPLSGDALAAVRRRVALRYPMGLETLGAFLAQWQANTFAGLPADEIVRAGERLAAADLAPSLPLLSAPPIVVVVGPVDRLSGPLESIGRVDVVPAEKPRPSKPDTLNTPSEEQLRRGAAAVAAAVKAHGGAVVLAAAKSLVFEGEVTVFDAGQEIPALFSHIHQDPDRFSAANQVFQMESRRVIVGDKGWSTEKTDSVVTTPLDSLEVQGLRAVFLSDLVHLLRAASAPAARPALRSTEVISGQQCDLVDFNGPIGWQRLAIDSATHRVVAVDGALDADLVWHERRLLSDFRRVNGLLLPFAERQLVDGERHSQTIVRQIGVNREIERRMFEPPAQLAR